VNALETQRKEDRSLGLRGSTLSSSKHGGAKYTRAYDDRKRPIRGLWVRNGRYYAQLTVADLQSGKKNVRRVPLSAETAASAKKEMEKLRVRREENTLPVLRRTPKFGQYAEDYIAYLKQVKDAKRESTITKEECSLSRWRSHLNELRLNQITRAHVNAFIQKRQAAGASGRTVNLDVIALRNVLKKALDEGLISTLPTLGLKPLRSTTPKRALFTLAQIDAVCAKGSEVSKNGRQFSDYVRLMAFCGSRRDETLRLKWADVSFDHKQLTIGADGLAKNYQARVVDFNPKLAAHLKSMFERRAPDSEFLFPSPQRGEKDLRAKTFRETLALARVAAQLPSFNFHDCRHFFVSICVMSGIDFMTIAQWVGHRDGGVLIGKVYGHLADSHRQAQAVRVRFTE
jgi:integrase